MSALAARIAPRRAGAPRPDTHPPGPQLTAVAGGAQDRFAVVRAPLHAKSSAGFLMICGAILIGALIAVLLLNTRMIYGSYEMARLQTQVAHIEQDVQGKQQALRAAQVSLPDRARELGMEAAQNPLILDVTAAVARLTQDMIGAAGPRESAPEPTVIGVGQ